MRRTKQLVTYYSLLTLAAALFLLPLTWLAATALSSPAHIYSGSVSLLPWPPTLENVRAGWAALPFARFLGNSLVIGLLAASGSALSASLVGFGFAVLRGAGRDRLFLVLLATMLIPPAATLVPSFLLFSQLGWVGTWLPLIVPQWCAPPFYAFLLRQFFRSIPAELWEAATLDGCSPAGLYWRIGLPLCAPATATVGLFAFVTSWNDLLGPLVYLADRHTFPVSLGLAFFQGLYYNQLHLLAPMALIAALPPALLCWLAQRLIAGSG
jgi:multiple sugar transport system permease protein